MTSRILLTLVGLAAAAACGPSRPGQDLPEEFMAAPADTLLTPYGQVPRAAWMGTDRWLVVAADWDEAVVADFQRGVATPLGAGPGQDYERPVDVFAAGDSLYVSDWGMRRVTLWTRDGVLAGAVEVPLTARAGFPKARDAAGRFYFEPPQVAGPDGAGLRDSGVVVRAGVPLAQFDTVVRLAPPLLQEVTRERRRVLERLVFGGQDRWGVLPDGAIWVARAGRNQVTWIDPDGTTRRGPQLPDPVYEVTEADREEFIVQFPPELRGTVEALPFAMLKPPFEGAFTGPGGEIWLEKSRPATDSTRRVHVVDGAGRLARTLVLPTNGRVIGVGGGVLLVAEQWAEGVRLLQLRVAPAGTDAAPAP